MSDLASVTEISEAVGSWSARIGSVKVEHGAGCLAQLGELVAELKGHRAMIVTDPGIRAAGHVDRALQAFKGKSIEACVFDGVEENPTTEHVETGKQFAVEHCIDSIVGLGGGSAMDCAKGINFLLTNGGRMEDYWGMNKAKEPMLPSLGVPTTAGTGSEAQSFALIAQANTHQKMACGDTKAHFQTVILDPELTGTVPYSVAVATGLDAISHSIESYVATTRNPISQMYAREGWRLMSCSFEANPLTARFNITHGIAVAALLPEVVRFNQHEVGEIYADLSPTLADTIDQLRDATGAEFRLGELGTDRNSLPELATEAATQWTASFNPRPVSETDLLRLYEASF